MPKEITLHDRSHVNGMDTLNDPRTENFAALNRCRLLENVFPGDPPIPRNGVRDLLVDVAALGTDTINTYHSTFRPPAVAVKNKDGYLFVFSWHISGTNHLLHHLECWDVDNAIGLGGGGDRRYRVLTLGANADARFGLLPLWGGLYVVCDSTISNYDNSNLQAHKIIEWNATTYQWEAREMSIAQELTVPTAVVGTNATGLTTGLFVNYAFSFVRRSDAAAFSGGDPISIATYAAGVCESIEDINDRKTVELTTGTTTAFGDATTRIDISVRSGNIVRYTYDGTGTAPVFTGLTVGGYVKIESTTFDGRNNGIHRVRACAATWFEIENADGVTEYDKVLSSATSITVNTCKVTLTFGVAAEHTKAADRGATHLRIYRTDHASTAKIAEGLQHRFLVDIPIYGSNYTGIYVDSTTQATLEGEDNFLTSTGYTEPPKGAFVLYANNRMFIGGTYDQSTWGRWYASEIPGADGGTSYALQYAQKYSSIFNVLSLWVDCDPNDGQRDMGGAVMRDDLFMFKESKTFMLRNADVTVAPECISREIGCAYPNTIVVGTMPGLGEIVFFMSNRGPAIIQSGGVVQLLSNFAIDELWPGGTLLNRSTGEEMNNYTRNKVWACIHDSTIYVVFGDSEDSWADNLLTVNKIFGYHRSPRQDSVGCMQVTFEDFTDEGGEGVEDDVEMVGLEPVIIAVNGNRAYYCGHKSSALDVREYRVGEFLRKGLFKDEFMVGA